MTNLECAISVLEAHREARQWADEAVARDMLARLGLVVDGEVGAFEKAKDITADEVYAKEQAKMAEHQRLIAEAQAQMTMNEQAQQQPAAQTDHQSA